MYSRILFFKVYIYIWLKKEERERERKGKKGYTKYLHIAKAIAHAREAQQLSVTDPQEPHVLI